MKKRLKLQQSQIIARFGANANCRVSYQNKKAKVTTTLDKVNWKRCVALTVMFDQPKIYMIDGDAAKRDGVRIIPIPDQSKRK